MHTHIVHRKGTSVSPDLFMLSAGPNPKSVSKAQVKGKDSVCVCVCVVCCEVKSQLW